MIGNYYAMFEGMVAWFLLIFMFWICYHMPGFICDKKKEKGLYIISCIISIITCISLCVIIIPAMINILQNIY